MPSAISADSQVAINTFFRSHAYAELRLEHEKSRPRMPGFRDDALTQCSKAQRRAGWEDAMFQAEFLAGLHAQVAEKPDDAAQTNPFDIPNVIDTATN